MTKAFGFCLALLMFTQPAFAEPFHHPFGEWREYNRDWLAACPDVIEEGSSGYYGISCFASTATADRNGAGSPTYKLTMLLNRLDGELGLFFAVQSESLAADQTRPVLLAFDGETPTSYSFGPDLETRYNTINEFYFMAAEPLIERMVEGNTVTLTIPVNDGDDPLRRVTLSLRGVSSSLDFMRAYARRVAQY